jgi:hypothetical protein
MADLKTLLGDKYRDGMTVEEILALSVEAPTTGMISKEHFDKVASEAANYKKQLRAQMTEAEAKAAEEAEKYAAIVAERDQLKAEKSIAENAKGLVAIGYSDELATEVATALYNGDSVAVIKAQAKFVDEQKRKVLENAVKETPVPPASNGGGSIVTKEQFDRMNYAERAKLFTENQELYNQLNGGN